MSDDVQATKSGWLHNLGRWLHDSWVHMGAWWNGFSLRARIVASAVLALGAGMLFAGWAVSGYAQTALADLGSTILLAVPIVLIGRILSEQVRRSVGESRAVAQDVRALRTQVASALGSTGELDDIAQQVSADLENQDEAAASQYYEHPDWSSLKTLLESADLIHAISLAGARVDLLTGSGDRVRVRHIEESLNELEHIEVTLEDTGGIEIGTVHWLPTMSIGEVVAEMTISLQRAHRYTGTPIQAAEVFAGLGSLLTEAVRVRREGVAMDLDPILEIPNMGQWAITQAGVESRTYPYRISFNRWNEPDWYSHVSGKTWVVKSDFDATFYVANDLVQTRAHWFVQAFDVLHEEPF